MFSSKYVFFVTIDKHFDKLFNIGIIPSLKVVHDRSMRKETKKKTLYLLYTYLIRDLSNPKRSNLNSIVENVLYVIYKSLRNAMKYSSFLPIKYGFILLKSLKKIRHNREISINSKCAFLKLNNF